MRTRGERTGWLSAHIFFSGEIHDGTADRVITETIGPFAWGCQESHLIERFFFVRYSVEGPHVRLRMLVRTEELETEVRRALLSHLNTAAKGGRTIEPLAARVRWVPYEPEFARYGGVAAMAVAEVFFSYSSEICIEILRRIDAGDRSMRLGRSLLAMIVLLHAFCNDQRVARFAAVAYRSAYLPGFERLNRRFEAGFERQAAILQGYVAETWECLSLGERVSPTLDRFRSKLAGTRGQLMDLLRRRSINMGSRLLTHWSECIRSIIPSYIHMTNNRLGLTVAGESYLAYLLERSLGAAECEERTSG